MLNSKTDEQTREIVPPVEKQPESGFVRPAKKLLLQENFILDRVAGSHHIFKKGSLTFVIPVHKNEVKAIYVKRFVELIEETYESDNG